MGLGLGLRRWLGRTFLLRWFCFKFHLTVRIKSIRARSLFLDCEWFGDLDAVGVFFQIMYMVDQFMFWIQRSFILTPKILEQSTSLSPIPFDSTVFYLCCWTLGIRTIHVSPMNCEKLFVGKARVWDWKDRCVISHRKTSIASQHLQIQSIGDIPRQPINDRSSVEEIKSCMQTTANWCSANFKCHKQQIRALQG
jgi:hypothetical protein